MVLGLKGKLIAFEGIDGSGKSSQTREVAGRLRRMGYNVVETAEPTDGPIGKEIRENYLSGKVRIDQMALQERFTADRAWHFRQMRPYLEEDKIIITDRFLHSSVTYGHASIPKDGAARQILAMNQECVPMPDLTLIFDLEPELAMERKDQRGSNTEIFEKVGIQALVREGYRIYFPPSPTVVWIDASRGKEEVTEAALRTVLGILRR